MTLTDLLVCMGMVAGMAWLVLYTSTSHCGKRSKTLSCLSHLRELSMAYGMWSSDNRDQFPFEVSTNDGGTMEFDTGQDCYRHFKMLGPYLPQSTAVLICPADQRTSAINFDALSNSNLSYFVNLDAKRSLTNAFLVGDRFLTNSYPARNGMVYIGTNTAFGWSSFHDKDHPDSGNIVLASFPAFVVKNKDLNARFQQSGDSRARLLMPE